MTQTGYRRAVLRILMVGHRAPDPAAGGYEVVWSDVAQALRGRGHAVTLLHPPALRSTWDAGRWLSPGPLGAWRIEHHNRAALDRHLRDPGPDLVMWFGMGGLSMSLLGRASRGGVPALGVVHDGWMLYAPGKDAWHRLLRRSLSIGAGLWTFNSEFARTGTLAQVPIERTEVVSPGVDASLFTPATPRDWGWRLAVIGRIAPQKGVDVALQALEQLPEATLAITGPGAAPAPHPRAVFHGPVQRPRLREAYSEADTVLFPVTWDEPFGLVPLEAMSVGRPVVATGTGGSAEYLRHEENCLLVARGDAQGLADAVRRLAAEPGLRERLVAGGRATAAQHTQEAFVARICDLAEAEARQAL